MDNQLESRPRASIKNLLPALGLGITRPISRNSELHKRSIERVILAMRCHLDRPMTNGEMADIACFSPCHFNRVFHQVTGVPPSHFHAALRLQRAKQLLMFSDLGVTDICFEVGYSSLGSF